MDDDEGALRHSPVHQHSPDMDATILITPYRRQRDWSVARHSLDRCDSDEVEGEKQYVTTAGWTVAWYAIPYALFAAWLLAFDGKPGTACAKPVNGSCPPARGAALGALLHSLPKLGVALLASLAVAMLIRFGSGAWRPITTAFSAAVIGAGAVTILFSVLAVANQ